MSAQLKLIYPNEPGFKKRGTSERAAKAIAEGVHRVHMQVLEVLCQYEMTSIEVSHALQKKRDNIKPRCSELIKMGYVEPTGAERHDNETRFPKEVLRATQRGRDLLEIWKLRGKP